MSTIKQIESELVRINQATFQDLMNHLLHLKGNRFISAPGSVLGKEKTRAGVPDGFFELETGYGFAEYTTQERLAGPTFFAKLQKDVDHCFAEKSGIKPEEVTKVILGFTDRISPEEHNKLKLQVRAYNPDCDLEIYTAQNLPLEILEFPTLAIIYLGVKLVKADILPLADFLTKTTKGIQPSLVNPFLHREKEMQLIVEAFNDKNIVVLSGRAGAGKTKIGVTVLEQQAAQGYTPWVIQSGGVPLWDDFEMVLQPGQDYCILFDDANKAVNNLDYLLSFLEQERKNRIKLLITVRDYARPDLNKLLHNRHFYEQPVEGLKDEEIRAIIETAMPKLKGYRPLVDRIVDISKGNARVALMAAYSVEPGADINYLGAPEKLYEKYFSGLATELNILKDPMKVKAIAIVSFFGTLSRDNAALAERLNKVFSIDWDELWDTILELHQSELMDVFQNEVCKVSDQILGTYAFFLCFIKPDAALIEYHNWVAQFIEEKSSRVSSTLIDVNNTFGYETVSELVKHHLDIVAGQINSENGLYNFYDLFWFYRQADALVFIRKWIDGLPVEPAGKKPEYKYQHNDHIRPSRYFSLLIHAWMHNGPYLRPAISIGLEMIFKQPSRLPEFMKFLNEGFSLTGSDPEDNFSRQQALLDILTSENSDPVKQEVINQVFTHVASTLLQWEYRETFSKGRNMTIRSGHMLKTEGLMQLRSRTIKRLIELYPNYSNEVDDVFQKYIYPGRDFDVSIHVDELELIAPFSEEHFKVTSYSHCRFVKKMSRMLQKCDLAVPESWQRFTDAEILKLAHLIKTDYEDREGISAEEARARKMKEFKALIAPQTSDEINALLQSVADLNTQVTKEARWWVQSAASELFIAIAETHPDKFEGILLGFFEKKLNIEFYPGMVISHLIDNNIMKGEDLYQLVTKVSFPGQLFWKLHIFTAIPEEQLNEVLLTELLDTFRSVTEPISIQRFYLLARYAGVFETYKAKDAAIHPSHNIITYLTEMFLAKPDSNFEFGYQFCQDCASYFSNHMPLLKQVYGVKKQADEHFDYDGKELEAIMKIDQGFFVEYLQQKTGDIGYLSYKFERFRLDFIWDMPEGEQIVEDALEIVIAKGGSVCNFEHAANVLFKKQSYSDEAKEKVYTFIERFIDRNYKSEEHMRVIMNVVTYSFNDQLLRFLRQLLLLNKDPELIRYMDFTKDDVIKNSRIPYLHREIEVIQQIVEMTKQLPDVLEYTAHIDIWEGQIRSLKKDIAREQKEEFADLYN